MSEGTILLVEDHRDLAETILVSLEASGFSVDYAADGLQALQLACNEHFDTIVLDVMLPGMDGFSVCHQLRTKFGVDTPVLMLTARDEIGDKLEGFDQGADDYLVKPFEMAELLARISALVKRKKGRVSEKIIKKGELEINTRNRSVSRNGVPLSLSPTGFEILRILVRESPNLVTREALESELWGEDLPDSDALRSHVYVLRKALNAPFKGQALKHQNESLIKTIKGTGFKLD